MGPVLSAINIDKRYSAENLLELMQKEIDNLKTTGDVTGWMDLVRTCRQPQIFWKIDYIEASEKLKQINALIQKSEQILYENETSLNLRHGFIADSAQEIAFHTIRARMRSEEGKIGLSVSMFEAMLKKYYDIIPTIRQSNLLLHAYTSFLCSMRFEEAFECMNKHWFLLKYAEAPERVSLGLWDNETILHLIAWFFVKHVSKFKNFYISKTKIEPRMMWNHKKISLLHFMDHDHSWVASICGLPFYEHASAIMPSLPQYIRQKTTPVNMNKYFNSEEINEETSFKVGTREYYSQKFNNEIRKHWHYLDQDKADNYLYSYYQLEKNESAEDVNSKTDLIEYLHEHLQYNHYNSVLEIGCGTQSSYMNTDIVCYLGIDISEEVCRILKPQKIPHRHGQIVTILPQINKHFELCFGCDIINHLNETQIKTLLTHIRTYCNYLALSINLHDDFREGIFTPLTKQYSPINMHKTTKNINEWMELIEQFFTVKHKCEDNWLFIFGRA